MKIESYQKVYDKERYHAWSDIIHWNNRYFLTFRTGTMHTSGDGYVEVLSSNDAKNWTREPKGVFNLGGECNDPKFLSTPECLILYFTRRHYEEMEETYILRTFASYRPKDSCWFTEPKPVLPRGKRGWRPKEFGGKYYMAPYHLIDEDDPKNLYGVDLYCSSDGLKWDKISNLARGNNPNETAIEFMPDGELIAFVRNEQPWGGQIYRSKPPYKEWQSSKLDIGLGGPHLRWWNDKLYLFTRYVLPDEEKVTNSDPTMRTAIFRVEGDKLERELILPGGDDCSYAGSVILENGNLLVSYYSALEFNSNPSTHLTRSAIYSAEISS